jgi:hypothetical protein
LRIIRLHSIRVLRKSSVTHFNRGASSVHLAVNRARGPAGASRLQFNALKSTPLVGSAASRYARCRFLPACEIGSDGLVTKIPLLQGNQNWNKPLARFERA